MARSTCPEKKVLGQKEKRPPPAKGTAAEQGCLHKEGERSGNQSVDALGIEAGAGLQRLGRFTGELDDALGQLRRLGDEAIELGAGQLRLDLEELGRRLRLGQGLHGVRSLFDALTARRDHVLAKRLGAA